jgi:hypothetical protein
MEAEDVAGAEVQLPEANEGTTNNKKRKAVSEASADITPTAEDQAASESSAKDEGDKAGAPAEGSTQPGQGATQGLSKNALKKLRKAEEMKVKRQYQRQQRKERKKKAKEEAKALGPRTLAEGEEAPTSKWKQKKKLQRERVTLPQRVVIDCSFDSQMTDRVPSALHFSILIAINFE